MPGMRVFFRVVLGGLTTPLVWLMRPLRLAQCCSCLPLSAGGLSPSGSSASSTLHMAR